LHGKLRIGTNAAKVIVEAQQEDQARGHEDGGQDLERGSKLKRWTIGSDRNRHGKTKRERRENCNASEAG